MHTLPRHIMPLHQPPVSLRILRGGSCLCGYTIVAFAFAALGPAANTGLALINVNFTPADLVKQADAIRVGVLSGPGDRGSSPPGAAGVDRQTMTVAKTIKGRPAEKVVLDFSTFEESQRENLASLLRQNGADPIVFFASTNAEGLAFVNIAGIWLGLKAGNPGSWQAVEFAKKMDSVFTGGADMLAAMSEYLAADPRAVAPASVGAGWEKSVVVGSTDGPARGMAVVRFPGEKYPCLFAASGKGDRLFRFRNDVGWFEEMTPALPSRSQQFAWADINGSGSPDLISWDGQRIRTLVRNEDGKFADVTDPVEVKSCLGLSPCALTNDRPAVLVSTTGLPLLLNLDRSGNKNQPVWRTTILPGGAAATNAGEANMACIVADFNNSGRFDVIQPRTRGGVRWKTKPGGFDDPVACPIASLGDRTVFTLGDFNQDGRPDVFLSGAGGNSLWEADSAGNFRDTIAGAGSVCGKLSSDVTACLAVDFNYDGRADLAVIASGAFAYHFNRGFRCFGEEGGMQLDCVSNKPLPAAAAMTSGDLCGGGALDLAVAFADGSILCFCNDSSNKPTLRLSLPGGAVGPVTIGLWPADKPGPCFGCAVLAPGAGPVPLPLPDEEPATAWVLKWTTGSGAHSLPVTIPTGKPFPSAGLDVPLSR